MPADHPERVVMRANAYADDRMKGVRLDEDSRRVVHAALVSAFFVGYSAAVADCGRLVGRG